MEIKPLRFQSVTGGQFDGRRFSDIPKNGWSRIINLLSYHGRLNLRGGYRIFTQGEVTVESASALLPVTEINGMDPDLDGYGVLVATKGTEFAFVSKNGIYQPELIQLYAGSLTSDEMPWILRQYKGVVYGARRNTGFGLARIEGDKWSRAGRPAPATPLTTDFVNTGSNVWKFKYTYLDSLTGNESNPSSELSVTSGATGTIDLDDWAAADADIFWDKYRLYATKANGAVFYPIADLSSGTTTYNFDVAAALAGTLAYGATSLSTRNAVPDSNTIAFDIWNERGWISDGENVKYSAPGLVEGYSTIQNLPFDPNDNDTVTTLKGWGNYFLVAKNRSIVQLTGYDRTSFEQKLWTSSCGCRAPHSMKDCEGKMIWLSDEGFFAAYPTEQPVNISTDRIKTALARADQTKLETASATVIPDLQLYVFVYRLAAGGWGGLAYNWRDDAWSEFDYANDPTFVHHGFDHNERPRTFALGDGTDHVLELFSGNDDNGQVIPFYLLSGAPDTGGVRLAGLQQVNLLCDPSRYAITFRAYKDGAPTVVASRTVRLDGEYGWKQVQLSTKRDRGTLLQVEISGSIRGPWSLSDWEWDVLHTMSQRRRF